MKTSSHPLRRWSAIGTALAVAAAGLAFSPPASADESEQIVVSRVAHNGTKGYLEVDGEPFTMLGVQNFGEWQIFGNGLDPANVPVNQDSPILDEDWLENVFEKTAAAGFKTAQIELSWKTIQPDEEGVYDWSLIDKYVAWAKKYDLKLDWVWFGTNGVGGAVREGEFHGYIATVPTYLEDDKYWDVSRTVSGDQRRMPLLPEPGKAHFDTATYLFQQEQAAVHAMFDHLAVVDTSHQTILFQLYNEPDAFSYFSTGGAFTDIWRTLVDRLGAAVKTADYVVATRMNFQRGNFANADRRARFATFLSPNVDFIGPDTYDHNPLNQVGYIEMALGTGSPIGYIPETGGNSEDKTPVLASVLAAGGFLNYWMLNDAWATELTADGRVKSGFSFYGDDTNVADFQSYTEWELGVIPELPTASQRVRNLLSGVNKISPLVAASERSNMAAFNAAKVARDQPTTVTETVTLGGRDVTFRTSTKDVGIAIFDPEESALYVTSDTFGRISVNAGVGRVAEAGHIEAGAWVGEQARIVSATGDIDVLAGEVVRITDAPVDTTKPVVTLVAPMGQGPVTRLDVRVDATDDGGLKRVVANIYRDGVLVQSTQTAAGGVTAATHTATVTLPDGSYSVRYNAEDLAGNISQTGTFAVTIDATAPAITVKDGASFTQATGASFDRISVKLYDAGKIDKVVLNGRVKDLVDDVWSDLNGVVPGAFGAVRGENTLTVYDVAGNTRTTTFVLN